MKPFQLTLSALLIFQFVVPSAFAADRKPADRKPAQHSSKSSKTDCGAFALDAAEEEYGNALDGMHVTRRPNNFFVVTVGIGNPEDGAHSYLIQCPDPSPLCNCKVTKEIGK